ETLLLEDESRSKMLKKQNDPKMSENKAELSAEQAFWSRYSVQSEEYNLSASTTIVEVPKELPKVHMEKVLVITALKETLSKLKGKYVVNEAVSLHFINPELLKIDVAPLAPKLRNNRITHTDYLRHTQEETTTLREIVKSERLLNPLNTSLDYACKYTKRIKELLIILQQTCPCINDLGTKLMAVNPKNNNNKIRLTNASGSQLQGNTKNDRIQRAPSKAKKNKLEGHLRTVRPSLNKKKSVVDTKAISYVINSKLKVNDDLKYATCNGCLFSDNHDSCVLAYINSVNASLKSKSVMKPVNRKIWQPTGKMFTTVRHIWRPTGRTFTIVENVCPLTRISTTAIVPLMEPILIECNTNKLVVTLVYSRKSKAAKKKVPVSNPKINKSLVANKTEPKNSWGSTSSNVPSSLIECRNYHVAKIMGYDDYKIRNVTISRVYFVEGLGHNLFFVGQFCDSDVKSLRSKDEAPDFLIKFLKMIQVGLKVPVCRIQTDNETEFVNQMLREYYEEVGISHETSVACSPQQNGVVERRNRTLIEAARTMLIYAQAPLFLWAEAVATAYFTQNRSIIRLRHRKIPYELLHNKLPDLSFLHVFGALCYPTNDSENLGKLQPKADIRIFIGYAPTKKAFQIYNRRTKRIVETIHVDFDELTTMTFEQSSSGPALNEMTPATISSRLVQKFSPSTSYVPPSRNDWDLLFQPMFDELLNHPPIIPQDVKEDNLDIKVAHIRNDPLFGVPIPEVTSAQSSSTVSPHKVVQPDHSIPQHNSKWTKDHPLNNIIGQLSRPFFTQLQLHEQALFCYYDAFLTFVEPKTYKEALTQSCWIEAMQEELKSWYQARPTKKHVHVVKRIFRYLRGTVNRGLWYPKDSSIALTAFADADHAGYQDTRRSTSGSVQFLGERLISWTMDTTIDQQVAMDKALVPHAQSHSGCTSNLYTRILGDNHCPSSCYPIQDGQQEAYHEFGIVQGHATYLSEGPCAAIRTLTDVNINKLYQPWRSFAAIINKCLTEKSSGYDSLRLSQAQILWGIYHKRNINYAYLMWEDFVYQVEHKNSKKSNEMYYPQFTKVIIHHFMSKDPSIPRRNKKEYYAITTGAAPPKPKASVKRTRSSSDTSTTPPSAAASPSLTASIKGKQIAKASKAKNEGTDSIPGVPDVPNDEFKEELSWNSTDDEGADDKGKDGDGDEEDEGDDGEEGYGGDDDEDDDGEEDLGSNVGGEEGHVEEEEEDELYRDVNINQGRDIQATLEVEDSHMTLTPVNPDGQQHSSSVSSQFVISMLNPTLDVGMESIFETTSQMHTQTSTSVAPLPMTAPTMTPSTIATITTTNQAPILPTTSPSTIIQNLPNFGSLFGFDNKLRTLEANFSEFIQRNQFAGAVFIPPTTAPSTLLQDLPNFGSLFGFDNRRKTLEANFFEFIQTNQFAGAVSSILGIVQRYMDQRMNEAVKVAVQIQPDHLRDEAQKENDKFLKTINENMQKIIKEQVKEQVKVQVSKILPKIEQTVNEQLEAEVLTRSSNSSKTSYDEVKRDDDKDDEEEGGDDEQEYDEDEYDEEMRDEESFDPILKPPKNSDVNAMVMKILDQMLVGKKDMLKRKRKMNFTETTLEANFSEFIQRNQFAGAVFAILEIMNEAVKVAVQIQSDRLHDEAQRENDEFLKIVDENMQKIIKEKVKEQVKALVEAYESDKIILDTYEKTVTLKRRRNNDVDKDEEPSAGPDRGSKRRREGKEPESASTPTKTATRSAGRSTQGSRSQQLKVDTLTPELLAGPTYELMKGSYKSLVELKYHLEEVFKATIDQLDWVNPKGQQYLHNLLKPLPLIPNNRGPRVIPFEHFINNDLEYLRGDKAILSGADNRPPMLEKDMYDSWKSRMELYMLNRQHGRMILESVEYGPLLWPTVEEDGVTRLKKYPELSAAEAI
nr:hypothetical protein [Tanacetum cinerariifolium]